MSSSLTSAIRLTPLDNVCCHHAHDHHQLVIGLTGQAEFEIDGQCGMLSVRGGCFVPAGSEHFYEGIGENRQLIIDLPDDAPALSGLYRHHVRLFDQPGYFELDDNLCQYLQFMVLELSRENLCSASSDLLATTLLNGLHNRLHERLTSSSSRLDIAMLDAYIEAHLDAPLCVDDLARKACLSSAHFSEVFRQQTGLSPYQYVLRKRLDAAQQLLESTSLPLITIAERTGFANQSALSHAFRRHLGHPPSALRQPARMLHFA
ncbi:helix-turn-helix domain-containing protein [Phytohalomonas tamaricis]|uniref:helix-turn-helix domain-containing protein n=1 Tax=Phytohalomonas tamaricis TaxID=2081032 RepID=UPI000D0B1306|nr:helix-turn-helix domain-containing protein [Phytohalomonas tamaricis]